MMNEDTLLLDTNIVSYLFKNDSRILRYAGILEGKNYTISFMTAAELFQWAAIRKWGERRKMELEDALDGFIILPSDIEICRLWGNVRAMCRTAGRQISAQDAWIAATAIRHRLPLVTHNPADFVSVKGIEIITKVDF